MIRIDATIRCEDYIHYRPSHIIKQICDLFPETKFVIDRGPTVDLSLRKIDPKKYLQLSQACLLSGERIQITTEGPTEHLAACFLKGILENLQILYGNTKSQSPAAMKEDIAAFLSSIARDNPDPMRHLVMKRVDEKIRDCKPVTPPSASSVTTTITVPVTANLHGAIVEVLPRLAKHYACTMHLHYTHSTAGDLTFDLSSNEDWVKFDILAFTPPAGTPVTVTAFGDQSKALCDLMAAMLQNLAKVDAWIRVCFLESRTDSEVVDGIAKIIETGQAEPAPPRLPGEGRECQLNNLLLREMIVVNRNHATRELAIGELTAVASKYGGMDTAELRKLVGVWSERVNVSSDGFAYIHARVKDGPVIMLAVGVYERGIEWPSQKDRKHVIALIIAAIDAPNTYMGYVGRLFAIFRRNRPLIEKLRQTTTSAEVISLLKASDATAQSVRNELHQRLLIVESVEDEITIGRHELLTASPRMQEFRLEYVYAIGMQATTESEMNRAEFSERLRARITEFRPEYVLFHTGLAFQRNITWYEDLVRELRSRFPNVRFGYQAKQNLAIPEDLFSGDDGTKRIQSLVFRDILGI